MVLLLLSKTGPGLTYFLGVIVTTFILMVQVTCHTHIRRTAVFALNSTVTEFWV